MHESLLQQSLLAERYSQALLATIPINHSQD
jgi:hypothetical protein